MTPSQYTTKYFQLDEAAVDRTPGSTFKDDLEKHATKAVAAQKENGIRINSLWLDACMARQSLPPHEVNKPYLDTICKQLGDMMGSHVAATMCPPALASLSAPATAMPSKSIPIASTLNVNVEPFQPQPVSAAAEFLRRCQSHAVRTKKK